MGDGELCSLAVLALVSDRWETQLAAEVCDDEKAELFSEK